MVSCMFPFAHSGFRTQFPKLLNTGMTLASDTIARHGETITTPGGDIPALITRSAESDFLGDIEIEKTRLVMAVAAGTALEMGASVDRDGTAYKIDRLVDSSPYAEIYALRDA